MTRTPKDAARQAAIETPAPPLARTVGPPILKGSTVLMSDAESLYDPRRTTYGRGGLATQEALAEALCALEGARRVRLFPSGLAALAGAMLAVLKQGDEVLVTDAIYKPTRRFCDRVLTRFGIVVRYFPPSATADAVMALAGPAARLVVLESPASLTFELQDAPAIARAAKARGLLTLMDNTWAAARLFKPLAHGIDISVQSLTKYVAGHGDVFMGSAAVSEPRLCGAMDRTVEDFGWAVSADEAYQALRGLRTLETRMVRHQASALEIALWLRERPEVAEVLYPALPDSPGHALWKRDYSGAAGLLSVVLRPCGPRAVEAFLNALRVFGLGFSWGGFESLALNCDPQFNVRNIRPTFVGPVIRLSIGLEDPAELIADLQRGFAALAG